MTAEPTKPTDTAETPLQSWKEIAAYLDRDERTARRWEEDENLPIRRHRTGRRSSVYAYPSEIEVWRAARKPKAGEEHRARSWRRLIPALAGGVTLLIAALIVEWGPIMNPPRPLVEASEGSDAVSMRQVWADDKTETSGKVSPDGRYLSFVDWEKGAPALRDLKNVIFSG